MTHTNFFPAVHGFYFANGSIHWSYEGTFGGVNLCGGMALSSLDHYYAGLPIPTVTEAPREGTPLHDYIYQRQIEAHYVAMPWLGSGESPYGPSTFESCVRGPAWRALKSHLDRRQPIPILLCCDHWPLGTNSHWVVAIGYNSTPDGGNTINLYDNNYPRHTIVVHPEPEQQKFRIDGPSGGGTRPYRYRYFVPWTTFVLRDPRSRLARRSVAPIGCNPWQIAPADW